MKKQERLLICVDSDGCAMDTMEEKHRQCFGPELVAVYHLEPVRELVLSKWNKINLYSETRGINRFLGLILVLKELMKEGHYDGTTKQLEYWAEHTSSLSEDSLRKFWQRSEDKYLRLALEWSESVNRSIRQLGTGKGPFCGVKEALEMVAQEADIVVVSSANAEALNAEWQHFGLSCLTNRIMSQNDGSKAECIRQLILAGYRPEHLLMVGDAPGDIKAAVENQVCFYPILCGREAESWAGFWQQAVIPLKQGGFTTEYQQILIDRFYDNLKQQAKQHGA